MMKYDLIKMNMMMKTTYRYLLLATAMLCITSCDELVQTFSDTSEYDFLTEIIDKPQPKLKVVDVNFAPDYKTFTITTKVVSDIGTIELEDSSKVRPEVIEMIGGIRQARYSYPHLVEMRNIEAENVRANDIRILALVDLTLSQSDIDRVKRHIREMLTVFKYDNLYISFMDGADVSPTMKVTDYVMDHHFKRSDNKYVYLYRAITQKKNEMVQRAGVWQDARNMVMITFSDEKVYNNDNDTPIDPDHYTYEGALVKSDSTASDVTFTAFYASLARQQDVNADHERNVLWMFCNNHGGMFMTDYNWVDFKTAMYNALQLSFPDSEFYFINPNHKVYRGDNKKLEVNFYNTENDSLIAGFSTSVRKGEIYSPIIVNGSNLLYIIMQGITLGVFIMLVVWIVFQLIVPFISYRLFLRKYVIRYTGQNMSVANKTIEERCYLCKAPFEVGDSIVVKCEHTMHKNCWDENGYHCPEYSDRCKHGSHYYNKEHLRDRNNAPFFLKWILMAIAASTLAWLCFTIYADMSLNVYMNKYLHYPVTQLPTFGLTIGFFLTLGFAFLVMRHQKYIHSFLRILLRACIASASCYMAFTIVNIIIMLFDINTFTVLLNWIPWTVSGFIIAYCSTFGTKIVHRRLMLFLSVILGFLSMYAWSLFFSYLELDYRVLLLFSFIIFSLGLAGCIATLAPHSERYFLNVSGAIKGMDIALYKWFRNNPDMVVTIGKSVDCSLQLSWDIQGDIAPIQAEIRMEHNTPYLTALEPGVYINGIPLEGNKKVRLYHGKTFTIGQTTFTYIEKDR